MEVLEKIGYYPLINGFSKPFNHLNEDGDECFIANTHIEDVYLQYNLDNSIQDIVFPEITKIENHLKTILGYVVSENMGVNDKYNDEPGNINPAIESYLDITNYQYSTKAKSVLKEIKKTSIKTKSNPTAYYRNKKNHIPPWILFRNIYLWQANSLYRILPSNLKELICSKFIFKEVTNLDLKIKTFSDSFEIIREFRNCVAHGSRIYAFKSKPNLSFKGIEILFGPNIITKEEFNNSIGKNDIYSLFLCILILTPEINDRLIFISKLNEFRNNFEKLDRENNWSSFSTFMNETNLPTNFISRLLIANDFINI